ncbi:MAG: hypothetical protein WCM76_16555 [Bacteroidota bacterium]
MKKNSIVKHYCQHCMVRTNHTVLLHTEVQFDDVEKIMDKSHTMLECRGCNSISILMEMTDYDSGAKLIEMKYLERGATNTGAAMLFFLRKAKVNILQEKHAE